MSKEALRAKLADVIRAHILFNGRCEACGERATHQSLHQADVLLATFDIRPRYKTGKDVELMWEAESKRHPESQYVICEIREIP